MTLETESVQHKKASETLRQLLAPVKEKMTDCKDLPIVGVRGQPALPHRKVSLKCSRAWPRRDKHAHD